MPSFDLAEVFDRFGARIAILETPRVTHRFVSQVFSEDTPHALLQPVTVTVRHEIGSDVVDVMTRRIMPTDDQTLSGHMRDAVTDLLLNANESVAPDRLSDWARDIALRPAAVDAGSRLGYIDGTAGVWREIHDDELVSYGMQIGELMIAVVAADQVIDAPAVKLWPTHG